MSMNGLQFNVHKQPLRPIYRDATRVTTAVMVNSVPLPGYGQDGNEHG